MMSARPGEEMIEDCLRQLREALQSTSPERRDQIVSDLAQHIAGARAEEPSSGELAISRLLGRTGTREAIAAAYEKASDDSGRATGGGRQPPSPVRAAVRLMYAGAAMTILTAFAGLLTRSGLRSAIEQGLSSAPRAHGLPALTPGQLTLALLIGPADLSVRGPASRATEACLLAAWLTGLAVIVLLWQRSSGKFFNGSRPRPLRRPALRRSRSY